jgi:hypothetical protein
MSSSPVFPSIETGLHAAQPMEVIKVLVQRSMMRVRRMPSAFIPSLIMPVFQLIAFSGAFGFAVTSLYSGCQFWRSGCQFRPHQRHANWLL